MRCNTPALGHANKHNIEQRIIALEIKHRENISRAFNMNQQTRLPVRNRNQRLCIGALEQGILTEYAPRCIARFSQCCTEVEIKRRPRAACAPCTCFTEFNELKCLCFGDRRNIAACINHCALPCKYRVTRRRRNNRARHARRPVDCDGGDRWVHRRRNIKSGIEHRFIRRGIIARINRINASKTEPTKASDDPRRHPFAARVDHRCASGHSHTAPSRNDAAIGEHHRATLNRG